MTDIPSVSFDQVDTSCSHIRFSHPDGRKTTVPDHGDMDVPKGLLFKIVRHDLEMSMDDFLEMQK